MLITAGGAILKERTGSWSTIFYICGVCQLLAGLFFGAFAEVERALDRCHDAIKATGAEAVAAKVR